MSEKQELLNHYITTYTPEFRFRWCELCKTKYRFENYSMRVNLNDVDKKDFIVQDTELLKYVDQVIKTGECSVDNFTHIFNKLSLDQIYYIGY